MDKEQAIDLLDNLIGMIEDNQDNDYDTALRMAIEALKAQLSQEGTTSDLISRQAAIDALQKEINKGKPPFDDVMGSIRCGVRLARNIIEDLPSAQPDPNCSEIPNNSDTVSRQAVIDAVDAIGHIATMPDGDKCIRRSAVKYTLSMLPPAQPERAEGEWVYGEDSTADCVDGYRCSQCGFFVPWDYNHKFIDYINDYAYCPNCGADMRGEQDG